jgi:hypothetical protein
MRSRGSKGGRPPNSWIVIANTEKERVVRADGERWFNEGGQR